MLRTWVLELLLQLRPDLHWGRAPLPANNCSSDCAPPCHEIGQDAKIKLGPPLNGIDGRKSGTFEGFNYSPAHVAVGRGAVAVKSTVVARPVIGKKIENGSAFDLLHSLNNNERETRTEHACRLKMKAAREQAKQRR